MKSVWLSFIVLFSISRADVNDHPVMPDIPEGSLHFKPEHLDPESDLEKPGRRPRFVGTNFAHYQDIPHGEREIRVFYDEVIAMETVVKSRGETALFYREVTDGKKLVQLVYTKADTIADCDVTRNRDDVKRFIARFLQTEVAELEFSGKMHTIDVGRYAANADVFTATNSTFELLDNRALRQPYTAMVDILSLKSDCQDVHHLQRQIKHERESGDYKTRRNPEAHSRNKRGVLVIPGTNWCGQGDNAHTYEDLGEDATTDRCCRDHDFCPHYIEGFETKYNLFNYRFSTVSHCYCDER